MKKLIAMILVIACAAGLAGCGGNPPSRQELSRLVAEAVLSDNASVYYEGECCGEGHTILGSRIKGDRLKVYALTTFGNYGFQNGMFIKISGSGVIPAVLTFRQSGADWELLETEYPRDGTEYVRSIKRMFPLKYRSAALHSDSMYTVLASQERSYAEAYLKSIGREAEIGEYRDLDVILLTDLGVSVEVSNRLCCDKSLGEYPYWIGTNEVLKDGKRCVRSLSYDEEAGQIVYRTVEEESGTVTEIFVFDALTGEELSCSDESLHGTPEKCDGVPLAPEVFSKP